MGGRSEMARDMLMNQVNTSARGSDLSKLNDAATTITQEAAIRNMNRDIQEATDAELAQMEAAAEAAAQLAAECVEADAPNSDDDDLLNDPDLAALTAKRLEAMKLRHVKDKMQHAQGHGEYREIVEEDFIKEVCGSEWVIVHFYHLEFIRCKV